MMEGKHTVSRSDSGASKTGFEAGRPWVWLLLGGALFVAANFRWGIGVLAWVVPVPLMRYLRMSPGWRPRAALGGCSSRRGCSPWRRS